LIPPGLLSHKDEFPTVTSTVEVVDPPEDPVHVSV
jgi:hypothetical protein